MMNLTESNTVNLQKLTQVLDESLDLLKQASIAEQKLTNYVEPSPTLLDQCLELCEQHYKSAQEPIRTVHYFACPNQGIVSQTLATLANTRILNNIDPRNDASFKALKGIIKSQALIPKFANSSSRKNTEQQVVDVCMSEFLNDIQMTQQESSQLGQRLVICDNHCHPHAFGQQKSDLLELLAQKFPPASILSILIVSDPVDSFLTLQAECESITFEQYCQHTLDFIKTHPNLDIIRYEDFLKSQQTTVQKICQILDLPYNEDFILLRNVVDIKDTSQIKTTENDLSNSAKLFAPELISEILASESYSQLREILNYSIGDELIPPKIPYTGIISYAQNFEDVMLWRALYNVKNGFYIDVGAQHPMVDSVSKAFYEKGWRGIHIEATPAYAELLRQDRPDELVIQAALSDNHEPLAFYEIPETGISTGELEIALRHIDHGFDVREITVSCLTLADVFTRAGERNVHWLKIDVEGMEKLVLSGWGVSNVQPWIVVVESTLPLTQIEAYEQWEPLLIERNYQYVYFDGLNRYYVSKDHPELVKFFYFGPNLFDSFTLMGTSSNSFCSLINSRHKQQLERLNEEIKQLKQSISANK